MWKFNLKFFLVDIHFSSLSLFSDFVCVVVFLVFILYKLYNVGTWVGFSIDNSSQTYCKVLDCFHFRNHLVDIVMRVNVHC